MLITFSGLDGAGKSTLIEWLRKRFEEQGRQVAVVHMYHDVGLHACARALLEKLPGGRTGRPGRGRAPRTASAESPRDSRARTSATPRFGRALAWNKTLRLCAYPLDLLIFACYRLYVERFRRRVLITDRYFYDTLVDVADGERRRRGTRLLARLTPTPHVPVYLDISPEEAFARKGERSIDYLARRRAAYRELFARGRGEVVLDSGGDLDVTCRRLEQLVRERMFAAQ